MEVTFKSESEAYQLATQLYGVVQQEKKLIFESVDPQAIKVAIELANIDIPKELRRFFPMPPLSWDEDRPAIYIACLSAYNNGKLHGAWINADRDVDEIQEDIEYILSYSPEDDAEEWAIHDYQGFEGLKISEYEGIENVSQLAIAIAEHGKPFAVYCNYHCDDATVDNFLESYQGCYESEEDFVEEMLKEQGTFAQVEAIGLNPSYIDLEAIARDWFIDSYFSVKESYHKVYVFIRN